MVAVPAKRSEVVEGEAGRLAGDVRSGMLPLRLTLEGRREKKKKAARKTHDLTAPVSAYRCFIVSIPHVSISPPCLRPDSGAAEVT